MICGSCKQAGDHNANGNYRGASKLHDKCKWEANGCFCQHGVGENYVQRRP